MSPNPDGFLRHLRDEGYHPRSDKHSNALALAIVDDLLDNCPAIADLARAGSLVFDLNFTLRVGGADWNIDLVLGAPPLGVPVPPKNERITRTEPVAVQIAIELKSVMTEHRKAVKNRKRDLEAHHEHVHNYSNDCIAGGVLIINASPGFRSPLRPEPTVHRNPDLLVEHCLRELRSVASRGGPTGYGLDAKCAIVVDTDNMENQKTRYVTKAPAPMVGDPLHYDSFIRAICEHFRKRY